MPDAARAGERIFRGIPVSPGVCRGKILVLGKPHGHGIVHRRVADEEIPAELKRFEQALVDTRHQILEVQRQVTEGLGAEDASIFDAHLLVLEDPTLIEEVTRVAALVTAVRAVLETT
jgi:phosphotransferase system enzyme I (PtsI)